METISKQNIPQHIAIIMDGNRRWARRHGLPDLKGHERGSDALEGVVEAAANLGIKTLTVYALSTENITERAKREVNGLFALMLRGYRTKAKKLVKNGVKIAVLGPMGGLPEKIKKAINELRKTYIENESIKLNIALNYGGKREMVDAIKGLIKDGISLNNINEKTIEKHLYTTGQHDPELVIRTGGRVRLSNFLLWQTAYSELYFTKVLWPDFDAKELKKAVLWYQSQQRNFGK